MLSNYFKVILRSLLRNKLFSLINLMGLSIGLTSAMLLGLYVADEFSFDRFHENTDRIYEITIATNQDGKVSKWTGVPNQTAPTLLREIPEVEKAVRILPNNFTGKAFVSSENIKSSEKRLVWADPDIFQIFSIPFIQGDPATALQRPHTAVLSEDAAIKYFGTTNAIGKSIKIDRDTADFEVTGVMKNAQSNTRFQYPVVVSFSGSEFDGPNRLNWGNASFDTYVLANGNTNGPALESKINSMLARTLSKDNLWFSLEVHPLKDIHLQYPDVEEIFGAVKGDLAQLKILMGLGVIIILIAAFNYMNLSTAQSQRRFKEIGINKTLGATNIQLARKFYLETSFFVLIALLISVALVVLFLPFFNDLTGKTFSMRFLTSPVFVLSALGSWVILTLLAGAYPAQYLSAFSPKEVLKGTISGLGGNSSLRKGLVVIQFAASGILIISTLILYQQLSFIREKKLGYEPEQVIAIGTRAAANRDQVNSLKAAIESLPFVSATARSQNVPGEPGSGRNLRPLEGDSEGKNLTTVRVTREVLDVLGIKLLAGTTLPDKNPDDTTVQVVLNKTSVDFLGLSPEDAINRKVRVGGFTYGADVVGVTEDFHFSSLRQPIGAYAFHNAPTEGYGVLLVKISSDNLPESIRQIENEFKKIIPSAFEYTFLDQQLQTLYASEQQLATVILLFSGMAIFIACLGLYALAAYTTEQRTKEIGIRKVMGASVFQLAAMLSRDFIKLVAISFVIAAPLGYFAMNQWLQGFAYRIEINGLVFIAAGLISLLIAWATVGFESLKAARSNPMKALRTE